MIKYERLEHRFVEYIPEELVPGILYISMEYATATHSCCCGCGEKVVTPFTPTDWKMTFDGETISLTPSIGNWNQPCRSHYFIDQGRVIEAVAWSDEQVEAERRRNHAAKTKFYGQTPFDPPSAEHPILPAKTHETLSLWRQVWNRIIGNRS